MARDDEYEDDDRPTRKKRDEDEDDDDRPRKKSKLREEEDLPETGAVAKPMPLALVGAIALSLAWSLFMMHATCLRTGSTTLSAIQLAKMQREQQENFDKLRAAGININVRGNDGLFGTGMTYTMLAIQFFLLLMSLVLFGGGLTLVLRKGFGKFLAMGAPVGMILVEVIGFGVILIFTRGTFLALHNVEFLTVIFLSLVVAGCNGFLLLNKEVSKALR